MTGGRDSDGFALFLFASSRLRVLLRLVEGLAVVTGDGQSTKNHDDPARSAANNHDGMVAALYVEKGGVYFGLPDVDPWDEERDARLYAGPWPVVAHPPCARWSSLAFVNQAMHGYKVGDDDGCFEAALRAVRTFGGVLEHPAGSLAWSRFDLPKPGRDGWTSSLNDPGLSTEVSQVSYGHRARKRTWLYCVGVTLPALDWRDSEGECIVGDLWHGDGRRLGRGDRPRMYQREALSTPEAFRDVLLGMARSARIEVAA